MMAYECTTVTKHITLLCFCHYIFTITSHTGYVNSQPWSTRDVQFHNHGPIYDNSQAGSTIIQYKDQNLLMM